MTFQYEWMPQIDNVRCTGCGDCIAICPTEALGEVRGKAVVLQSQACTYCAVCEDICPAGAIGLPYEISFSQDYLNPNNERH